jgi:hypothetical protein
MTSEINGNVPASARGARPSYQVSEHRAADVGRLIRLITALAVGTVAAVAGVISYQHKTNWSAHMAKPGSPPTCSR